MGNELKGLSEKGVKKLCLVSNSNVGLLAPTEQTGYQKKQKLFRSAWTSLSDGPQLLKTCELKLIPLVPKQAFSLYLPNYS